MSVLCACESTACGIKKLLSTDTGTDTYTGTDVIDNAYEQCSGRRKDTYGP